MSDERREADDSPEESSTSDLELTADEQALLGAAIGAATGAIAGSMADVGIDDKFINQVKQQVTPGTSALFLLTSDAVQDRVRDAFKDTPPAELIASNLTADQEARLREVFGED